MTSIVCKSVTENSNLNSLLNLSSIYNKKFAKLYVENDLT